MQERHKVILFAGIPAVAVVGLLVAAVYGEGGLWRYRELSAESDRVRDEWAAIERSNTVLLHRLQQLGQDPIHLERVAAEQLHLARPGATLYSFEAVGGPVELAPVRGAPPERPEASATAP